MKGVRGVREVREVKEVQEVREVKEARRLGENASKNPLPLYGSVSCS
jgi:hypothetical protein